MVKEVELAPICLFVYNRLEVLVETISSLKSNHLACKSHLYIFSDGPRNLLDQSKVELVRSYVQSVSGFKMVTIIESNQNMGLAKSIVQGVTSVLENHDRVIVLEDDIKTSKQFLNYMNGALTFYKSNPKVMQVSGFLYPINSTNLPDTFFYQANTCWGWGTWRESWNLLITDCDVLLKTLEARRISWIKFNSFQGNEFKKQLLLNAKGTLNTWAIKWHATIKIYDGTVLHPKATLVSNIGFDGDGENCRKGNSIGSINDDLVHDISAAVYRDGTLAINRLRWYFKMRYSIFWKMYRYLISLI